MFFLPKMVATRLTAFISDDSKYEQNVLLLRMNFFAKARGILLEYARGKQHFLSNQYFSHRRREVEKSRSATLEN